MIAESLLVSKGETTPFFILIYYIRQSYLSDSNNNKKHLKLENFNVLRTN